MEHNPMPNVKNVKVVYIDKKTNERILKFEGNSFIPIPAMGEGFDFEDKTYKVTQKLYSHSVEQDGRILIKIGISVEEIKEEN